MLDNLHHDDFAREINSWFRLRSREHEVEIELIEVADKSPSPRQEMFVLTFRAPLTAPSEQGIFHLEHESLGGGELFLVPIRRDHSGLYYEAVFNRPR